MNKGFKKHKNNPIEKHFKRHRNEVMNFNRGLRWMPLLFLVMTIGLSLILYKFYAVSIPGLFLTVLVILLLAREFGTIIFARRISHRIMKPMEDLTQAFGKLSEGDYGFEIENKYRHQMGALIASFNQMSCELKEAQDIKDKYDKNQKELIAGISHDLKSPMTSILGYLEGIEEGVANSPEKLENYLKIIQTNAAYSNKLIDDLFLVSKLDLNQLPFNMDTIPVKGFFEDLLFEKSLAYEGVDFTYSIEVDDMSQVALDRKLFLRVLNNIYDNAQKYNDKEGCKINTTIQRDGQDLKIVICDNGPGIKEALLTTIFSKFYRADQARSKSVGGSGLGLSIAREIIVKHKGRIEAKNSLEGGLEITILLKGESHG